MYNDKNTAKIRYVLPYELLLHLDQTGRQKFNFKEMKSF